MTASPNRAYGAFFVNVLTRSLRLLVLVAAETAAVAALGRLGRRPPFVIPLDDLDGWLHTSAPADALLAVLRLVALGGALWLLGTTIAYVLACMSRVPRAVRVAGALTLPVTRRLVDAALAASIVTGSLLGSAAIATPAGAATSAVTSPPANPGVRDGHAGALASLPAATAPATPLRAPSRQTATAPASTTTPATTPTTTPTPVTRPHAPAAVTVQSGDSLWQLAAARVAEQTGRPRSALTDAEIARYWLVLCDANRAGLLSGDPNLIYPGEVVTLPPVG